MDEACLCEKQKHAYELMKDTPYLQAKIYAGGETVFSAITDVKVIMKQRLGQC